MDSILSHGGPYYYSIPVVSTSSPRQASLRNAVYHQMTRLSRSSSISRLFKTVSVFTLIAASVFFLSSQCISCHFLHFKNRIYNFAAYGQSGVLWKVPNGYSYYQSHRPGVIGSFSRYPNIAFRPLSTLSMAYLNRQDAAQEVEDQVIEEGVGTRDCGAWLLCRARLIVTKEGNDVTIQVGYNISGVGGVDRPVDRGTMARVSAVSPEEALIWTTMLLGRVHDLLGEVNCTANAVGAAEALLVTSTVAASCPSTHDPSCHKLITVEHCTIAAPSPSPIPLDSCEMAFDECEFTFKGETGLATFRTDGPADKSFTPVIVAKNPDVNLGVLNSNNIVPEFIDDSGAFPITDFGSQRFAPTQFKPLYIWQEQGSGIGHQTFHADQGELAKGRCLRIYFTEIQLVDPYFNLNQVPRSENKCVVFRTE
ncbi:unnamed protein product [Agarophyton chilense]|eukprot:gb/GEZJ01003988.1/.p1 GENE.gb/GEZJ01003988.1/~~gb/GEZJ01003988.1/.p1  ORF type:complete len:423 (-),score=36.46 gb/GEZJ01003988.1/:375-1643(-)